MIVAMQETATEDQIQVVVEHLIEMGFSVHRTTGERQTILAAVGSRNEIARVVAESGCGVVAPPDSPEAIVEILRGWASDTSSLDAMGSRGRMWAEKHHDRVSAVREFEVLLDGAFSRGSGHT